MLLWCFNNNIDECGGFTLSEIETIVSKEEAQAEAIKYLAKAHTDQTQRILSDLDEDEIYMLAYLDTLNQVLKTDVWSNFINIYLQLKVSRNRKGRLELLKASQSVEEEKRRKGAMARLASWLRGGED